MTQNQIVHAFVHIFLLASMHCKESLVWFEASYFLYTINIGPSLGFSVEILQFLDLPDMPPLHDPADHRWNECWGETTHNPDFGPG